MRFIAAAYHACIASVAAAFLVFFWAFFLIRGNGHSVHLGPLWYSTLQLGIGTIAGVPAVLFCSLRSVQLFSRRRKLFQRWLSLRGLANVFALMATALIVFVATVDTPWHRVLHTNWLAVLTGGGKKPAPELTDERLQYPELPLRDPDLYAWSVVDLDGNEVEMSAYSGKVLFLNVWATWCAPCRLELPNIQRLYDAMKERDDVAVVLVSKEEPETVRAFLEENRYSFPTYLAADDVPGPLRPRGIPATFILSPEGKIAYAHTGAAAWDTDKTKDFLGALAAQHRPK